jgi:hypothetical protein
MADCYWLCYPLWPRVLWLLGALRPWFGTSFLGSVRKISRRWHIDDVIRILTPRTNDVIGRYLWNHVWVPYLGDANNIRRPIIVHDCRLSRCCHPLVRFGIWFLRESALEGTNLYGWETSPFGWYIPHPQWMRLSNCLHPLDWISFTDNGLSRGYWIGLCVCRCAGKMLWPIKLLDFGGLNFFLKSYFWVN